MSEDFDPKMQAFLLNHSAPEVAEDFADRLVERAGQDGTMAHLGVQVPLHSMGLRPHYGARRLLVPLAVAAALVAGVWIAWPSAAAEGDVFVTERTTLAMGRRAIAVAEAKTQVSWQIDASGQAKISQPSGNVFYRVEPGGPFEVTTPKGVVRVVGTSFRVEIQTVKSVSKAALAGVAAGAVTATVVVVSVYEGQVVSAADNEKVALAAGEAAVLDDRGIRRRPAVVSTAKKPTSRVEAAKSGADFTSPAAAAARALVVENEGQPTSAVKRLREEKEALDDRVVELERKLAQAEENGNKPYDLMPETLNKLADKCALRWDHVSLNAEAPSLRPQDAEKLELSAEEQGVVDESFKKSHGVLADTIRATYVAITGDDRTGSMAFKAMFDEIQDKTPGREKRRVFQRLSAERAGRLPVGTPQTPYEEMMRIVTSSGNALEQDINEQLGPAAGRKVRDLHGGWNSRSGSSYGCPKVTP